MYSRNQSEMEASNDMQDRNQSSSDCEIQEVCEGMEMEISFCDDDHSQLDKLKQLNRKFRLSCDQVVLLNNEVEHLQGRYDNAVTAGRRSFRYFLRLKIATIEGVRNMMYEYACRRANELDDLHARLISDGVIGEEVDLTQLLEEDSL